MENESKVDCIIPNGKLLIIGGAEAKEGEKGDKRDVHSEVLESFIKSMDVENPVIELITSASSSETDDTFKEYQTAFLKLGAGPVNHIHHADRDSVSLESFKERINQAHGIFFAGGDQLKLTSIYGGTDFLYLIKTRYIHDRLVIAGTSAGAMALSTPMIYEGTGRAEMIAGNVKVTTGLEFLRDVCIDTHFVHRGRFVRMSQVISTNPSCIGMGIEEDTAVIIENGTEARVEGSGVVIIIDGHLSGGTNITESDHVFSIRGLRVDILSSGEKFKIPQMNPPHQ